MAWWKKMYLNNLPSSFEGREKMWIQKARSPFIVLELLSWVDDAFEVDASINKFLAMWHNLGNYCREHMA